MRTGVPERSLQVEHADLSLLGNREENQDRVAIAIDDGAVFLAVVDGMGGHADGARAAEVAIRAMLAEVWEARRPLFDPDGFLHLTIGRAHEAVVAIGRSLPQEIRPRATCAVCLVQLCRSLADDFWHGTGVAADHRTFVRHGFQRRQTESLVKRGVNESARIGVERPKHTVVTTDLVDALRIKGEFFKKGVLICGEVAAAAQDTRRARARGTAKRGRHRRRGDGGAGR